MNLIESQNSHIDALPQAVMPLLNRASDRSRAKKVKFCGIFRDKFAEKSADFVGTCGSFRGKRHPKQSVKNGRFYGYFQGKFRKKSIGFVLIRTAFLTFF